MTSPAFELKKARFITQQLMPRLSINMAMALIQIHTGNLSRLGAARHYQLNPSDISKRWTRFRTLCEVLTEWDLQTKEKEDIHAPRPEDTTA